MRAFVPATTLTLLVAVIGASALLTTTPLHAQARKGGDAQPQMNPQVLKPLREAIELINKEKFAEAEAEVRKADAVDGKTAVEQFQIDDLLGFTLLRLQNYTEAALAYERSLESGLLPDEKVADQLRVMAQLFFQSEPRNMEKAALYGKRYLAEGDADDDAILSLVSQASFFSENFADAGTYVRRAVAAAQEAGNVPDENLLMILQSASARQNDAAGVKEAYRLLVEHYPNPERWRALIRLLLDRPGNTDRMNLNIFRLMAEVDALEGADEYTEAANVATLSGSPGDAQRFLDKGFASQVLETSGDLARNKELLTNARTAAADDQKALPQFEKEARAAADGEADVRLGEAYLSYDQPAKAIEAIRRGIGKGGLKSRDEAHLLLGTALLKAGDPAEARTAYGQVGGDYAALAELWTLLAAKGAASGQESPPADAGTDAG